MILDVFELKNKETKIKKKGKKYEIEQAAQQHN